MNHMHDDFFNPGFRRNPHHHSELTFEVFETLLDDLLEKVREAKYLDIQAAMSGSHRDSDVADEAEDRAETAQQALLDLVRKHCDDATVHAHRNPCGCKADPYKRNPCGCGSNDKSGYRRNVHPMIAAMIAEDEKNSPYAWVITKDLIEEDEEDQRVGQIGPRSATLNRDEIISHPSRQRFRMLDDDGEVYYEGFFVDMDGDSSGFEPLDDFGLPYAGCTTIQYWEKGKGGGWKTL